MNIFSDDLLAAHPEWASLTGQTPTGTIPQAAAGQPLPTPGTGPFVQGPTPTMGTTYPQPTAGTGTNALVSPGAPFPAVPPVNTGGNPIQAEWEATQNLILAQQQSIGKQQAVNSLQPQVEQVNQELLTAQEKDLIASRAYLSLLQQDNETQRAEQAAIQAAKNNPQDLYKVARQKAERASAFKYSYNLAGLASPIEVEMPPGYTGPMPPHTVARIQSLAEILADKASDADAMRKFDIEAARILSEATGNDVKAAQVKSGAVKLTLDQAEAAVRAAGLAVDQAQLAVTAAKQPPVPGYVWDETTNTWTTPAQASLNQSEQLQQMQIQAGGVYGNIPIDTLVSLASYNPPVLSDDELRTGLAAHHLDPATIDIYVKAAQAARGRSTSSTSDVAAAIEAAAQAYQTGSSAQTQQPPVASAQPVGGLTLNPNYNAPTGPAPALTGATATATAN